MQTITRLFTKHPLTTQRLIVSDYYADTDTYFIAVTFSEEDRDTDANAFDLDDFEIPGVILPMLIGRCGEPDELLGREFPILLPA